MYIIFALGGVFALYLFYSINLGGYAKHNKKNKKLDTSDYLITIFLSSGFIVFIILMIIAQFN